MSIIAKIIDQTRSLEEQNIQPPFKVALTKTQMQALAREVLDDLSAPKITDVDELVEKMVGGWVFDCFIELNPHDPPPVVTQVPPDIFNYGDAAKAFADKHFPDQKPNDEAPETPQPDAPEASDDGCIPRLGDCTQPR